MSASNTGLVLMRVCGSQVHSFTFIMFFSLTTALTAFGILLEDHQSMAVLCRMTCLNHVSFCHLADVPGPHQGGDCAALC